LPGKLRKPDWLVDFKRRIRLIDILDKAFEVECECEIWLALRRIAGGVGEVFVSGPPGVPEVGRWPSRVRERGTR